MQKWLLFVFSALIAAALFFYSDDPFQPSNLSSGMPDRQEWDVQEPENTSASQVEAILSQDFYFLNGGGQVWVFSSADDKYVLKLFKFKRFRPSLLVKILPHFSFLEPYRHNQTEKRAKKLTAAFNGHKIAFEHHREASGLIAVQLNPSPFAKKITLFEQSGVKRELNLYGTSFVLQKKGETLETTLKTLLNQKNIQAVRMKISQLFELYLDLYRKGIYDQDLGILHNVGTLGDRLIHLDVGRFVWDERVKDPEYQKKELLKINSKISAWLKQYDTQIYPQIHTDTQKFF